MFFWVQTKWKRDLNLELLDIMDWFLDLWSTFVACVLPHTPLLEYVVKSMKACSFESESTWPSVWSSMKSDYFCRIRYYPVLNVISILSRNGGRFHIWLQAFEFSEGTRVFLLWFPPHFFWTTTLPLWLKRVKDIQSLISADQIILLISWGYGAGSLFVKQCDNNTFSKSKRLLCWMRRLYF